MDYLKYMWPHIKTLMITVQSQDRDGDGLIDSEGLPDQTYDAWSVTGASAYCGGLHVATLRCVVEMARALDDTEAQLKYEAIFERAQKAYNDKLWNGEYYKYDSDNSSIMADMCCGHWYFRCSGMKYEVSFFRHVVYVKLHSLTYILPKVRPLSLRYLLRNRHLN